MHKFPRKALLGLIFSASLALEMSEHGRLQTNYVAFISQTVPSEFCKTF